MTKRKKMTTSRCMKNMRRTHRTKMNKRKMKMERKFITLVFPLYILYFNHFIEINTYHNTMLLNLQFDVNNS